MTPLELIERLSRHDYWIQFSAGEDEDWIGQTKDNRHSFKVVNWDLGADTVQSVTLRIPRDQLAELNDEHPQYRKIIQQLDSKFQREGPEGWSIDD